MTEEDFILTDEERAEAERDAMDNETQQLTTDETSERYHPYEY